MVFSLIFLLLLIVFFAFFIGKNLSNVCQFWFFTSFENVHVAILVLIAFGCGILVSILFAIIFKFKRSAKKRNQEKLYDAEEVLESKSEKKQDK